MLIINYCCGVYMRAAFIRLKDDISVAFIWGRRLFEGGVNIGNYKEAKYIQCHVNICISFQSLIN